MIRETREKLIVVLLILIFAVGLFFSVRFLKAKITQAATSKEGQVTTGLNLDAWNKIKHHFGQ